MAIIWTRHHGGSEYQVRTAGKSVRLYKDRVFHTQWNPQRPLAGGVWDLLLMPALALAGDHIRRVLVLGVGGGAALRLYHCFFPGCEIVGVELDAVHIAVGQEFFGLNEPTITLHQADALKWMQQYRGPVFDVIVEDLFTEQDGEPVRVASAERQWFSRLLAHLAPQGVLVINFEEQAQMMASLSEYEVAAGRPVNGLRLSQPTYGNCVGAFFSPVADIARLRSQIRIRLDEVLQPFPGAARMAQRFRMKRL